MRFFLIMSISLFLCSCKKHKDLTFTSSNKKDSIVYYYHQSKNKHLSYQDRLAKINQAYKHLNFSKIDSLNLAIIYKKIKIHFDLKQYDSVNHYNKLLFFYSTKIKNTYYKAKHHYINSYYNEFVQLKKDSAFYHSSKSKEYFLELSDSNNIGKRSLDIAYMQYEAGDYHGSVESSLEAIKYLSEKKNLKSRASSYDLIARNYNQLQLFEKTIKYNELAISITPNKRNQLIYTNNLAKIYLDLKNYEKTIELLNSVDQNDIKKINDKALIIDNLAYAKWLQNSKLNIEYQLNEAFKIRKQENNIKGLIDSYEHLAHYFSNKNPKKAINYANQLVKASRLAVHPNGELKALKIIMNIQPKDTQSRNGSS